jgi:hypothetical protein
MAELNGDFGISLGMDKINDALPGLLMLVTIKAGTAGRYSPLGGHACHLGKDQPSSTFRTLRVMHKMPICWIAVDCAVLRHRRNYDAVFELNAAHAEWHEHRSMIG